MRRTAFVAVQVNGEKSYIIKMSDEPVKPLVGLLWEFTLFSVWDVAHFVWGGWQWDGFLRAPGNAGQILAEL